MAYEFNSEGVEREKGILSIEIDGSWSAHEFARLLENIRETYLRLNMLDFLAREIDSEQKDRERKSERFYHRGEYYFTDLCRETLGRENRVYRDDERGYMSIPEVIDPKQSLSLLMSVTQRYTGDLYIGRIEYSSPGWLDFIGDLNPLKNIADFITNWRKENTTREIIKQQARKDEREAENAVVKAEYDYEVQQEKIRSTERVARVKAKADLAKAIIKNAKPLRSVSRPDNLERLLGLIDSSTEEVALEVAKDSRIKSVKALPPHSDKDSDTT
jgi:hypothetical protein